jgi:hypothetical protein
VHQRRTSFDFPLRSPPASWVLREAWDLRVRVRGACVHAQGLGPRGTPAHLALAMLRVWPSAFRDGVGVPIVLLSGLNTWPARTPANASPPASRLTTHRSGPMWVATPSPYETCIRYTSPLNPALPPRLSTALRAVLHSARASLRYGRCAVTRSPRCPTGVVDVCLQTSFFLLAGTLSWQEIPNLRRRWPVQLRAGCGEV